MDDPTPVYAGVVPAVNVLELSPESNEKAYRKSAPVVVTEGLAGVVVPICCWQSALSTMFAVCEVVNSAMLTTVVKDGVELKVTVIVLVPTSAFVMFARE